MKKLTKFALVLAVAAASAWVVDPATADTITNGSYTFNSLSPAPNGSGLGNYNVILFAGANGGSGNTAGGVNVDNSNTQLPTGGTDTSGSLFWMTSVADLRAFYDLQFGQNTINNIVLFLDLNESGNGQNSSITVNTLDIYLNSTTNNGLNPVGNDLLSAQQEAITGRTGGTLLTSLTSTQALGQIETGNGIDDWSIFTFINPYLLPADGTLLFNLQLSQLNSGNEVLSISGVFSACDITPQGCGTTGSSTGTTGTTTTSTGTTTGSTTDPTTGSTTNPTTTTTTTTGSTTDPTTGSTTNPTTTTTTTTGSTTDPTTGSTTNPTTTTTTTTGSTTDPTTGSTTIDPTTGSTSGDPTTTGTASTGTSTSGVSTGSSTNESTGTTRDVPEPASFLLLGAGLVVLSRVAKRKRD
jgi:hypothetical protein